MELLLVTAYLLTIIGGLEVMSRCCPRSALLRLTMQATVDCDTLHHGSRHRSLAQISPASHTLANVDRKRKLVMFYCSPAQQFPNLDFPVLVLELVLVDTGSSWARQPHRFLSAAVIQ